MLFGDQAFTAGIPFQSLLRFQQFGQVAGQPLRIEGGGQKDPRIALTGVTTEAGHHQPFVLLQAVDLNKAGGTAIGQPVVTALLAPALGDAVRVGHGQQQPGPALAVRLCHSLLHWKASDQPLPLLGQLPGPLQGTAIQPGLITRRIEGRQAATDIGVLHSAQQIPLSENRRQSAG